MTFRNTTRGEKSRGGGMMFKDEMRSKEWILEGIEPLLAQGEREEVPARETIYYPGTPSTSVYFVESGKIKISHINPSGRRIVLDIRAAGEMFGEMALVGEQHCQHHAEAMEDSTLIVVPKLRFQKWLKARPDIMYQLLQLFGLRIQELEELVEDMAFYDIRTRLSRQLLRLSHEYGIAIEDGILIDFHHLTHKDLAEMIGSSRENTTIALNRFAQEGVILKRRRGKIIITDTEGLRRLSEGWIKEKGKEEPQ
jgi:CRP/FNR family transcriptional regulator